MHDLLTKEQACQILGGISQVTFWRLRKAGAIPQGTRISPRLLRWKREDLEAYLKERDEVKHEF